MVGNLVIITQSQAEGLPVGEDGGAYEEMEEPGQPEEVEILAGAGLLVEIG